MTKYTDSFKLAAVKAYLEGSSGFRKVARQFSVDCSLLRRWVANYQSHSCVSLRKRGQQYSTEFKHAVLKHRWKNQLSLRQTAAYFGLGQSSQVGIWERHYYSINPAPTALIRKAVVMPKKPYPLEPTTDNDTQKPRDQLLAELEYLRMENAYLKKLEALKEQKRRQAKKP